MSDRNPISVNPIHYQPLPGENVTMGSFSKLKERLAPYPIKQSVPSPLDSKSPVFTPRIKSSISRLSGLIPNPTLLAKIEGNSFLRAAILSNPSLAEEISQIPALLTALLKNPSFLNAIISKPGLLSLIKENPYIVSGIIKNSNLPIESILEKLIEMKPSVKTENTSVNEKPHEMEKSTIASGKTHFVSGTLKNTKTVQPPTAQKQQPVVITKAFEGKAQTGKLPLVRIAPFPYVDARAYAVNPGLLALLGAAAFVSNRIKITGNLKDVGAELETQSESQPDAVQESDQIEGVGEISELHSVSEATI